MRQKLIFVFSILYLTFQFAPNAEAADTVYLRSPSGDSCRIIATSPSGSTLTITCAPLTTGKNPTPPVWSVGQVVIVYNVRGNFMANGVRKVSGAIGTTYTLTDTSGNALISSGNFVDPAGVVCSVCGPFQYGWAAPATLYTLRDHPRVWFDGPTGPLTTSLSDTSATGRSCTTGCTGPNSSGQMWTGLSNTVQFGLSFPYTSWYYAPSGGDPFGAAAMKWWVTNVNGSPDTNALTMAKYILQNPTIWEWGKGGACDETTGGFCNALAINYSDYGALESPNIVAAWEFAQGQLTTSEKSSFADWILNDNAQEYDGLGLAGAPSSSCAPLWTRSGGNPTSPSTPTLGAGTISISGTTVTGTSTTFGTDVVVGSVIYPKPFQADTWAVVTAVNSATSATIDRNLNVPAASSYAVAPQWSNLANNCGFVWTLKHHGSSPFADPTVYGANGGSNYDVSNNQGWTKVGAGYLMWGLALCGTDERACTLASLSSAYMWDHVASNQFQGAGSSTPNFAYDNTRIKQQTLLYTTMLRNSIASPAPPDLRYSLPRDWAYNILYGSLPFPNGQVAAFNWGSGYGQPAQGFADWSDTGGMRSGEVAMYLANTQGDSAAQYFWYWLTNAGLANWFKSNNIGGLSGAVTNYTVWNYAFLDPATPLLDIGALPTQFRLQPRGTICSDYSFNCGIYGPQPRSIMYSRTGLKSATDTVVVSLARSPQTNDGHGDVTYPNVGTTRVYRKAPLLTGDYIYDFAGSNINDNELQVGGGSDSRPSLAGWTLCFNYPAPITVPRWAATTHDVSGDAEEFGITGSTYAYWMLDLAGAYCPARNVARAEKHVLHLKKPGTQDYIVQYYDVASTLLQSFREFVHFRTKDIMGTTPIGTVNFNSAARTATLTNSSAGAALAATWIPITNNIYVGTESGSDSNGTYSGGSGNSFRVEVGTTTGSGLGAVSAAEWLDVYEPCATTSCTMPTIQKPAVTSGGGSATAVEIQDPGFAKVAVLARQGALITSANFTTTHSGNGQYVVAGMNPGTYYVNVNGAVLNPSGTQVVPNDNTLYFESTSGPVVIGQTMISLTATPSTQTVDTGTPGTTYTVNVAPLGGFTGTVTLSVLGLPAATTAVFGTTSINTSGSTTLTVTTDPTNTPGGAYPLTIQATSGNLTVKTIATLVVNRGDFSVSASPQTAGIVAGGSASYSLTIAQSGTSGAFGGNVNFSVAGLPTGATAVFSPQPLLGIGSATMQVNTVAGVTPAGNYPLTIIAASGTLQHNTSVTLQVTDFTFGAVTQSAAVQAGGTANFTLTVTAQNGFNSTVGFITSGTPTGSVVSFTPATVIGQGQVALSVVIPSAVTPGTYPVTVIASAGPDVHPLPLTIDVVVPPGFGISATPGSLAIGPGGTAAYQITVTSVGSFNDQVAFTTAGLPGGSSVTFNPVTVTGAGMTTMTVVAGNGTVAGTSTITVTGTSSTGSHDTTVSLIVAPAGTIPPAITLTTNPTSADMGTGSKATFNLMMTSNTPGMLSPAFTCAGLPTGATCTFVTDPVASNTSVITTTLTLAAPTSLSATANARHSLPLYVFAVVGIGAFGIVVVGSRSTSVRTRVLLLLLAVSLVGGMTSCGGGGGGGGPQPSFSTAQLTTSATVIVTGTAQINGTKVQSSTSLAIKVTQ